MVDSLKIFFLRSVYVVYIRFTAQYDDAGLVPETEPIPRV